ncbi:MAG: YebC/PmpR family DNA-binding transcriptional regulator [Pseudomonadota bacterium]
MAGHSKFKNIMHRKGAQDKKRAALFARLTREIIVATKEGGADPDANSRLRLAINTARSQSMPKDNIERAIKRGSGGGDDVSYEAIRYEGYAPGGVAVMVECLTNNRNRTASEIRALFSKSGGSLGESGSVAFSFRRVGEMELESDKDFDHVFEAVIEAGADDVEEASEEGKYVITCDAGDLHKVAQALEQDFPTLSGVQLHWRAVNTVPILEEKAAVQLMNFLETLESQDDVQLVAANFDIDDNTLATLE